MRHENEICDVFHPHPDRIRSLVDSLPDLTHLAELFKILSNTTRAEILYLLYRDELCVCDIAELLNSSVSNISHHLRILRTARLVKYRRDGRQAFYTLDDDHVVQLFRAGLEHLEHIDGPGHRIHSADTGNT